MWWLSLNKKGFLAGDVTVFIWSIIAFAIISAVFFAVFLFIRTPDPGETSIPEKPELKEYEFLDYYLSTKIMLNDKKTTMLEIIPLYCYNQDKELSETIRKISYILFPYLTSRELGCVNEDIKCTELPDEINSLGTRMIYTRTPNLLIFSEVNSRNTKMIEIPGFLEKSKACLEISENYNVDEFIDITYTEKEFESKVKEKSSFKSLSDKKSFLISPSGEIWRYNNDLWCLVLEETDIYANCLKGISANDLISCNGDKKICALV